MTLQVYTARVSYGGSGRFDVTRKSGGPVGSLFAPSWPLLNHVKDLWQKAKRLREDGEPGAAEGLEESAWREYEPRYMDEMRACYQRHRAAWEDLLARDEVTLCCYCVDFGRCHRYLLGAKILSSPKLGARAARYIGERVAA